jgi:putative ABC transport system substrate-binding protein
VKRREFIAAVGAGLLAAPLTAEPQQAGPVRTIGILGHVAPTSFEEGLRALGWVEGKNARFERRLSTDPKQLARFAAELARMPVDVIFAGNAPATRAAVEATRAIPIITVSADPVTSGVAASLARPGANVTGLAYTQLTGKRLELLVQAVPPARRVAFLSNPTNPNTREFRREAETVANALGIKLPGFEVSVPHEIGSVIAAVAKARPDAFLTASDPLFFMIHQPLIEAMARHRLPAMWEFRGFVEAGGLMSYGALPGDLYRRAATYADRILKGPKPADLPVEQATKFEFVINLKTAMALGLTIPPSLLARADEAIE